jgi:hypothetical protein
MKPNRISPGFDFVGGVLAPEVGVNEDMQRIFVNTLGFNFGDDVIKVAHMMPNVKYTPW